MNRRGAMGAVASPERQRSPAAERPSVTPLHHVTSDSDDAAGARGRIPIGTALPIAIAAVVSLCAVSLVYVVAHPMGWIILALVVFATLPMFRRSYLTDDEIVVGGRAYPIPECAFEIDEHGVVWVTHDGRRVLDINKTSPNYREALSRLREAGHLPPPPPFEPRGM